jgi:hypothetical protein
MTSPLSQAPAIFPEKELNLVQDVLHALKRGLALAQAAKATTTIMLTKMIAGQIHPSSAGTHTSPRVTMADAFIALIRVILSLPPSLPQVQREVSAPRNIELCQ